MSTTRHALRSYIDHDQAEWLRQTAERERCSAAAVLRRILVAAMECRPASLPRPGSEQAGAGGPT